MLRFSMLIFALAFVSPPTLAAGDYARAAEAIKKNPPDYRTAIPALVNCAVADHRCQYVLAYLKENGIGFPEPDTGAAITLYREAARQGNAHAVRALVRLQAGAIANPAHIRMLNAQAQQRRLRKAQRRESERITRAAVPVRGKVIGVTDRGLILSQGFASASIDSRGTIRRRTPAQYTTFFVYLNGSLKRHYVDGQRVAFKAYPGEPYRYIAALGHTVTLNAYVAVSELTP